MTQPTRHTKLAATTLLLIGCNALLGIEDRELLPMGAAGSTLGQSGAGVSGKAGSSNGGMTQSSGGSESGAANPSGGTESVGAGGDPFDGGSGGSDNPPVGGTAGAGTAGTGGSAGSSTGGSGGSGGSGATADCTTYCNGASGLIEVCQGNFPPGYGSLLECHSRCAAAPAATLHCWQLHLVNAANGNASIHCTHAIGAPGNGVCPEG